MQKKDENRHKNHTSEPESHGIFLIGKESDGIRENTNILRMAFLTERDYNMNKILTKLFSDGD